MKVFTTKGLVELSDLKVVDVIDTGDNHRKIATEFYLGDELVRRDVTVSMLRPVEMAATEGQING